MSTAGIFSNRGDRYQTLVAFDLALTVLTDPEFQWLEIDSTTYLVDDVVVGKSDGTLICCQCKKNQANFRAWSITDLADELDKAFIELARNNQVQVRFYSRSEFGAIAKLREFSTTYSDEADYLANLTKEHTKTNSELVGRIAAVAPSLSTYEFLCRTSFEISSDYGRLEEFLHERLRLIASNSISAFGAFWIHLDKLGSRMESGNLSTSAQHRLTKGDLTDILREAGAMLVPVMSIALLRASYARTSTIGRSWHRDIAGYRITSPIVDRLLSAIDDKEKAILLTGLPGSGKTCVMLCLQEALEQRSQNRSGLVPLFIQSREYADLSTAAERQSQGLPEQWVEQASRLAEDAHVVVVIDSLDVLSIAREHNALTYFLAQIDQLLLIPNVTVVTACRNFDRKYDRRIAALQWDCEIQCPPLDWESEVVPLLDKLSIDSTVIDSVTSELISNPRELALFVELVQRGGSFNVVTSQALAQRYLNTVVLADTSLGDSAMKVIETIASKMLTSRSLSISRQGISASQDVLRRLHSLNVLQDTHEGKLTFGHQTLLDVLVISGALRQGVTLKGFIQGLPPVPFVRPSIRSFVTQLAMEGRREYRKQLRTVLTGNAAFHIRRLIAESFAQQMPEDEDWSLIRDLREKHREVFQVIYTQAAAINWHHFWLAHLVPVLKDSQDTEGFTAHMYRIEQWSNEDASGVISIWLEALSLDWLDNNMIARRLCPALSNFEAENLPLLTPLLEKLLRMPRSEYSLLGRTVLRCVKAGVVDDALLWTYVAGDISRDNVMKFHFDNKLHCQPHEFGDKEDDFLKQQMVKSTILLDFAVEAVEQWSQIKSDYFMRDGAKYRHGFLDETSYSEIHTERDNRHLDGEQILLNAMETAILDHAKKHSDWWLNNRERLCFNREGALCYFAVLALINCPQPNIELAGLMLCDRSLLEFELSYELGKLVRVAFIYLESDKQDAVMANILSVREEAIKEEDKYDWILKERAGYISAIPSHLRSQHAEETIRAYEIKHGALIVQPYIRSRGGMVSAPFSYEVFLKVSDVDVLRLLDHYSGHEEDIFNFLIGGEREVLWQLREASSRHPSRFLELLKSHWVQLSVASKDEIIAGAASYMAKRYGNLQGNGDWEPIEEIDASILMQLILDELERHFAYWRFNDSSAKALQACANVIQDTVNAARLVFLAIGFSSIRDECDTNEDASDWLSTGINMKSGNVAEALVILASNLKQHGIEFPELLPPTLFRFAQVEHRAVKAVIIHRLPYLLSLEPALGWELFNRVTQDGAGLWKLAEPCLYNSYDGQFEIISPLLDYILREGSKKDKEVWGRISALAALSGQIEIENFLVELDALDTTEAWHGAASVWTNTGNFSRHRAQCLAGIEAGLKATILNATAVARLIGDMFGDKPPIAMPLELMQRFFNVIENDSEIGHHLYGFAEWLVATAQRDPKTALAITEIYLAYIVRSEPHFYDHENRLVQLLTRLFAEAEEREEADEGAMLERVVAVQDLLLSIGVSSVNDWLEAAERQ
jgi:hypothetical protein